MESMMNSTQEKAHELATKTCRVLFWERFGILPKRDEVMMLVQRNKNFSF